MSDPAIMSSEVDTFLAFFKGSFNLDIIRTVEDLPKSKLTIFVSSTFTDTYRERNILHERILPSLREKIIASKIQFILYDMRFGVKDENTRDHMTWQICHEGIQQCYDESDGLFFLSLQGDKYGYMPLPKYLQQESFTQAITNLDAGSKKEEILGMLKEWYRFDENHFPSPCYNLMNLTSSENEKDYYSSVLPTLRDRVFHSAPFQTFSGPSTETKLLINHSITEWEVLLAYHLNHKHCLWVERKFNKDSWASATAANARNYGHLCDSLDNPEIRAKLNRLTSTMKEMSPEPSHHVIATASRKISPDDYDNNTPQCQEYLKDWETIIVQQFTNEIELLGQKKNSLQALIEDNMGIPLLYFQEMIHHVKIAIAKSSQFYSREEIVEKGLKMITVANPSYFYRSYLTTKLKLALVGKSGSGKTALMSKLFMTLDNKEKKPKIIRFCGTSRYSLHGIDLLISMCLQILLIHQQPERVKQFLEVEVRKNNYEELVGYFHNLLDEFPVDVFIDSMDQLSNEKGERSLLSFLHYSSSKSKPSSSSESVGESRIMISTLPDEYDESSQSWKYLYLCEKKLKEDSVPILEVPLLNYLNNENAIRSLADRLLQLRGRSITMSQWKFFYRSFAEEPTILYLNLAVEIMSHWRSFDDPANNEVVLVPTVKGLIHQLFSDLEKEYGPVFTSTTFALITFSHEGISDLEIQDILSLDKEVLKEIFQYSSLKNIFPLHVWLRLKARIKNLIVEKENYCYRWYHRQLWETAHERYSSLKKKVHAVMGDYFTSFDYCRKEEDVINYPMIIRNQPLLFNQSIASIWCTDRRLNPRRFFEGAFHLIAKEDYDSAIEEVCSLEYILGSVLIGNGNNCVRFLLDIVNNVNAHSKGSSDTTTNAQENDKDRQRLNDYFSWLRKNLTIILTDPTLKIPQTASAEPLISNVKQDIIARLSEVGQALPIGQSRSHPHSCWIRERTVHDKELYDRLLMDLYHHSSKTNQVIWNPNGKTIASCSDDHRIIVTDVETGAMTNILVGHSSTILAVGWNHDGSQLVSGSVDSTMRVWNIQTGAVTHKMYGCDTVYGVSWCCVNQKIVAGGNSKGKILIWDLEQFHQQNDIDEYMRKPLLIIDAHGDKVVQGVRWNPSNTTLASCALYDTMIKIWDGATGMLLRSLDGVSGFTREFGWKKDGVHIIAPSDDIKESTIKIWNAESGDLVKVIGKKEAMSKSVSFNHSETLIAFAENFSLGIWDVEKDSLLFFIPNVHGKGHTSFSWSPVNNHLVTSAEEPNIKIWNLDDQSTTLQRPNNTKPHKFSFAVTHPTRPLLAIGSNYETLFLWDYEREQLVQTLKGKHTDKHDYSFSSVCWNCDGVRIAAMCWYTVYLWSIDTATLLETLVLSNPIRQIRWNFAGSFLAAFTDKGWKENDYAAIKVWNPETKKYITTIKDPTICFSFAWSGDSSKIVVASEKNIKVFDVASGNEITTIVTGSKVSVSCVGWSPDQRFIASGFFGDMFKIWSSETYECIYSFVDNISRLEWNSTGSQILAGGWRFVCLFDVVTGTKLLEFKLPTANNDVKSVFWTLHDRQIGCLCNDETFELWDCVTVSDSK